MQQSVSLKNEENWTSDKNCVDMMSLA